MTRIIIETTAKYKRQVGFYKQTVSNQAISKVNQATNEPPVGIIKLTGFKVFMNKNRDKSDKISIKAKLNGHKVIVTENIKRTVNGIDYKSTFEAAIVKLQNYFTNQVAEVNTIKTKFKLLHSKSPVLSKFINFLSRPTKL